MQAKSPSLLDHEGLSRLATERAERHGPLDAEILECRPNWHIVLTEPNMEGTAAGYLISRRFGVYCPQFTVDRFMRGRKRAVLRPLFPGYIFVFVWNIDRHARRIQGCPGVVRLMRHADRFVVVADKFIDVVRAEENKKSPILKFSDVIKPAKRPRRRNRHSAPQVIQTENNDIVRISAYSALRDVTELDDSARVGVLHEALGLAS